MDKLFKPWTTLSPAPPKFQSCFLLPRVETGGQNKSNPTAWHVTHTFFNFDIWGRGCRPILSSRFEYFVHLRSGNVGCLWDASILCRKNGKITYIEYTSNLFLIFCFLSHQMSSKGSTTLGDLLTWTLDLTKLLSNELVAENAVFFRRLFAWLATWLCFYMDSCCICNSACFHSAFSPVVRIGYVFAMILATDAIPCVFTVPFHLSCE